jgi:hypothetical protein
MDTQTTSKSSLQHLNIYFISGLGADKRAFDKIELSQMYNKHFIDWLKPFPKETVEAYALRMSANIDHSKPFVLVGLSFGGLICIEIAKFLKPLKVILISSISCCSELPWYFKIGGRLRLHKTGINTLLLKNDRILFWFFGTKSNKLQQYLKEMIAQTSSTYLTWAMHAITHWKHNDKPECVIHIHGTKDKLFPLHYCHADIVIQRGSHFMIVTHAGQISKEIGHILDGLDYQV